MSKRLVQDRIKRDRRGLLMAKTLNQNEKGYVRLVGWFLNVLVNNWTISRTGPKIDV